MKALASAEKNNKAAQKPETEPAALQLEALDTIQSPSTPLEVTDAFKEKREAAANIFHASAPEATANNQFSYIVIGLLGLVFIAAAWISIQLLKLNANESAVLMAEHRPHMAAIETEAPKQKINSVIAHQLEDLDHTTTVKGREQQKLAVNKQQPPPKNKQSVNNQTVAPAEQVREKSLKTLTNEPVAEAEPIVVSPKANTIMALPAAAETNITTRPLPPLVASEDQVLPTDRVIFGEINGEHTAAVTTESVSSQAPSAQTTKTSPAAVRTSNIEISTQQPEATVEAPLLAAYNAFVAGDNTKAKSLYRSVLKSDVRQIDALLGMAAIAQRQSRDKDAVGWYQKVLEIEPQNAIALTGIVSVFPNANPASQIDRLNQLIIKQPTVASHHAALGNLYSERNAWDKAQSAYFNANRYDSNNADYAFNLAISLEHLGKPKLATAQYQRALSIVNQTGASSPNKQLIEARLEALK